MDEEKLKKLLDFQKFAGNPELLKLIKETEKKYPKELTDDELEFLNAAGPELLGIQNNGKNTKNIN